MNAISNIEAKAERLAAARRDQEARRGERAWGVQPAAQQCEAAAPQAVADSSPHKAARLLVQQLHGAQHILVEDPAEPLREPRRVVGRHGPGTRCDASAGG